MIQHIIQVIDNGRGIQIRPTVSLIFLFTGKEPFKQRWKFLAFLYRGGENNCGQPYLSHLKVFSTPAKTLCIAWIGFVNDDRADGGFVHIGGLGYLRQVARRVFSVPRWVELLVGNRHFRHPFIKLFLKLLFTVRLQIFPFSTFISSPPAASAPSVGAGKLTDINTRALRCFHCLIN